MSPPSRPTPLARLRRRTQRPSWLQLGTVTAWLAVGGFVAYAIAYSYAWSFLAGLGATPEEVGFTQPGLVIRVVLFGSTFVAALGLAVLMLVSLPFLGTRFAQRLVDPDRWTELSALLLDRLRSRRHRWLRGRIVRRRRASRVRPGSFWTRAARARHGVSRTRTEGLELRALRRRTGVVTVACALLTWSAFWAAGQFRSAALWGRPPLSALVLFVPGFYVLARLRHFLVPIASAVLLVALACAWALRAGNADARALFQDQTRVSAMPVLIGLQLSPVDVSGSSHLPAELVLLGHTDNVYVLASADALYRVGDSDVMLKQRRP